MIEQYVDVPKECDDEDGFNDCLASFKGRITQNYAGKEVRIIVREVRK